MPGHPSLESEGLLARLGCLRSGSESRAEDSVRLLQALIPHRLLPVAGLLSNRGDLGDSGRVVAALAEACKSAAGNDAWSRRESSTLKALLAADVDVIVLKGALLAYTVYPSPAARIRTDTDVLVPRDQVERAVSVLKQLGYETPYEVTGTVNPTQHMWVFRGERPAHAIDLHWSLSQHPAFDGLFLFDSLRANAIPVEGLCARAMGLCAEDAVLHACIHYFGHHQGEFRPLQWVLDVDLLWRSMDDDARARVVQRAATLQISGVVAALLEESRSLFSTPVAISDLRELQLAGESQWRTGACAESSSKLNNFIFSLRSEPTLEARALRIWRTLVPPVEYMRERSQSTSNVALLWSYVERMVSGVYKAIR